MLRKRESERRTEDKQKKYRDLRGKEVGRVVREREREIEIWFTKTPPSRQIYVCVLVTVYS